MMLFLCAQDLHELQIGILKNTQVVEMKTCVVSPEEYLFQIDTFLKTHTYSLEQLEGLCVVTGPGSFTSTRVILTIANTLRFVYNIPMYYLTNPEYLEPRELLRRSGIGSAVAEGDYATTYYDRPPHITQPRGDKALDV